MHIALIFFYFFFNYCVRIKLIPSLFSFAGSLGADCNSLGFGQSPPPPTLTNSSSPGNGTFFYNYLCSVLFNFKSVSCKVKFLWAMLVVRIRMLIKLIMVGLLLKLTSRKSFFANYYMNSTRNLRGFIHEQPCHLRDWVEQNFIS